MNDPRLQQKLQEVAQLTKLAQKTAGLITGKATVAALAQVMGTWPSQVQGWTQGKQLPRAHYQHKLRVLATIWTDYQAVLRAFKTRKQSIVARAKAQVQTEAP